MKDSKFPLPNSFKILAIKTQHNIDYTSKFPNENSIRIRIVFTLSPEGQQHPNLHQLSSNFYSTQALLDLNEYNSQLAKIDVDNIDFEDPDPLKPFNSVVDLYQPVYLNGSGFISHLKKQNIFVFHEVFEFSPVVQACLHTLQLLTNNFYSKDMEEFIFLQTLNSLSNYWF